MTDVQINPANLSDIPWPPCVDPVGGIMASLERGLMRDSIRLHDTRLLAEHAERISTAASQFPRPTVEPAELTTSRDQVLAAATARLVNEPLGVLAQGLNPSRFDSWMPGLRRKAYRYFPSTTELLHEVLADAVKPDRSEATDRLVHAMSEAADLATSPTEIVERLTVAYLHRLLDDSTFRLEMIAWVVMRDAPTLRDDLNDLHESLVERAAGGLKILVESFGLDLRAPVTWRDLATMLLGVIQGALIQADVAGDDFDPSIVVKTVTALIIGVTCSPGEQGSDLDAAFLAHTTG